ncbi:TonB-dependent receptor [Fulvivirga imtechensis AK7]|uniref:TonB-dependent receptor n=1 Tax=Fulvivirga imtechensis AK7 TaxID=1237149 RepID=L8JS92_9BACT|nr:TonB-dependent receptor [Fulvivirga imtechensis]ELR71083.1 TonB-dependent receptor [Fulvivirga imtechensis AK7]
MDHIFKIYLLVLLWAGTGCSLYAQNFITGKVIDSETQVSLPGVHITISGTTQGTTTDLQGNFTLGVPAGNQLTFSYVGYEPETISITEKALTIRLKQSFVQLNQVVVSASRENQLRTDVPAAIGKISPNLLEDTKAASLEQVINKVSGVYMVNLGNEQHSMSIRQPLSLKSLFLYMEDGIPIRPTGVFNHNSLVEMNMAALKSIEVIKGPASSIYGSEAIGGSINFITQSASAFPTANISIQKDNLGYNRLDIGAGNTLGKFGLYAGGYYAYRKNGYREHCDFNKLALSLKGDYQIDAKNKLTTSATIIDYGTDMTGSIDSINFYSMEYPSMHTFTERTVKALRLRSTLEHLWNDRNKTKFTLFYRDNSMGQIPAYRVKNDRTNPLKASGEINENSFRSYGALAQHMKTFGFWDASVIGGVSIDFSPNSYYAEFINIARNEEGVYTGYSKPDSLLTDYEVSLFNTAVYSQLEMSPVQRLRVVLALRYDRFDYSYENFLTPDAFSGAPNSDDTFENLSPKVGFTYDFGRDRGLYANYSIGFVPPQVSELYRGVKVPVLEPSVYKNLEVGGWFSIVEKGYFDISFYQMRGTNEVINVLLDDGTRENRNAGETLHQGVEYGFRYVPLNNLHIRVGGTNATHEYSDYQELGESYNGNSMESAPNWIANTEVQYKPPFLKGSRIGLEWQHVGPYYMDAANTEKYEGFDLLNMRVGYTLKGFDIWCNIMNITNELYATNASKSRFGKNYSPGDPRTFSIGIGYKFSKKN